MALSVRVDGGRDLTSVRRNLRMLGDRGLSRQLSAGLQRAAKPFAPAVRAEVPKAMPSGYAPTLSKSLRFRISSSERRGAASVVIRVYGDGKAEKRDVPALNRGVLRHPVYGRRSNWVAQKVRSGFVDRPADRLAPDIRREMNAVVDYIADQITKG